ncbi:MAG: type II toxin-antitoxin system HicB family antitoxin [Planctomycetes bacterium]|nr:type II toxin-antitoxin system HicB family antitoxin [Planctomycetota bacterium]
MITRYVEEALLRAKYERIDDEAWAATVPGLRGVIATGSRLEACRRDLSEVVEGWILVRVSRGLTIPKLGRASIRVKKAS